MFMYIVCTLYVCMYIYIVYMYVPRSATVEGNASHKKPKTEIH